MEYSQETMELLESVLSNISESERWQYRLANIQRKKVNDLKKKIENEEKKIEDYGKQDKSKLKELEDQERKMIWPQYKTEKQQNRFIHQDNRDWRYAPNTVFYGGDDDEEKILKRTNQLDPKAKAMHERINRRTAKYDTTAKHEAAMILIEALNTLLNE